MNPIYKHVMRNYGSLAAYSLEHYGCFWGWFPASEPFSHQSIKGACFTCAPSKVYSNDVPDLVLEETRFDMKEDCEETLLRRFEQDGCPHMAQTPSLHKLLETLDPEIVNRLGDEHKTFLVEDAREKHGVDNA